MAALIPPMPPLPPAGHQPVMLNTSVPPEPTRVAEAHPKRPHHRPKNTETAQDTQKPATPQGGSAAETEEAANTQPSDASPIGQLSAASGDTNTADRQTLLEQINGMENTLNGIHRSFSSEEQKTATLIRTFITRAREALKTDDLEGAKNYSTKAKVLLQELTKP